LTEKITKGCERKNEVKRNQIPWKAFPPKFQRLGLIFFNFDGYGYNYTLISPSLWNFGGNAFHGI
jgi:hypothetical protein